MIANLFYMFVLKKDEKHVVLILILHLPFITFSQKMKKICYQNGCFYNLENLFDTINEVAKNDEASPIMELKGNKSKVYWDKIDKLASVIAQIGEETAKTSPAILGVSEVENLSVLEDLVKSKYIKGKIMKLYITSLQIKEE